MELHSVQIGKTKTENNVFLAPLAGYTCLAFRSLCLDYGAGFCYTEMVSAKGLIYKSENTKELLKKDEGDKKTAVQLFGNDPSILRAACESEELASYDVVDLNMGCPVPKIFKNGEGSSLLENPLLAEKIVSECVKSGKAVTVKMRIGLTDDKLVGVEFAKRMEGAGAKLLTVHGRTREKFYSGEVNFGEIEKIKNSVQIPVIANGGVFSLQDGETLIEKTGADGIMIARGAMENPQIFADFTGKEKDGKYEMICRQYEKMQETEDARFTTVYMRKMVAFYLKGVFDASRYKVRLFSAETKDEILGIAKEIFLK